VADPNATVTFAIPGTPAATRGAAGDALPLPAGLRAGHVETSVRVAVSRDAGMSRVEAVPGTHVVAISIDGGPDLILHPHTARDLLQAQTPDKSQRSSGGVRPGEVLIPPTLRWPAPEGEIPGARSRVGELVGGIVIKAVNVVRDVITDAAKDAIKDKAAEAAARFLAKKVDEQVTEGVYNLRQDVLDLKQQTPLAQVPARDGRFLVFIHGTFSSTAGGFGRLWTESPGRIADLVARYGKDGVYALDHATLCVSPIRNALSLATVLPRGARLHLVTHSRGGLVAETLALACARRSVRNEDLAGFIPEQRDELKELVKAVVANDLHVDRIVRVGCPIRGTLLASKRLDAYLSVVKWTMDLAGWGIAGEVVDFLGAVAQQRLEADALPGLAAQVPLSPLVQWLHADPAPIPGELRVVSGDVQGDSVLTWIKTLMADGFYWTDNDVVVQTRSMYGGARRQDGAMFRLDRGGRVLHTRYFARDRVAEPVFKAILDDRPDGFQAIGPLSWSGEDSSGDRARREAAEVPAPSGTRPVVFLIPGFGASRLSSANEPVWPVAMTMKTVDQLKVVPEAPPLTADGFVGDMFDALHTRLESTHDVVRFPYDWRVPLEVEAARLAGELKKRMDAQDAQPVRLLTHGSGGLLARVLQLDHRDIWDRLLTHPQGRLLMLAPPNDGMWMPMQVLSGDEAFGGLLTSGAPPFGEAAVRAAFGTMPGLMQLQAQLMDDRARLGDLETWKQLAATDADSELASQTWHHLEEQHAQAQWGIPSTAALTAAFALRRRLDAAGPPPPQHARKIAIVAGSGIGTADGLPADAVSSEAGKKTPFVYAETTRGDGRVAVARTQWPGVTTYLIDADHGSLPSLADAVSAYAELLGTGTTRQLPLLGAAFAGEEVRTQGRASRRLPPEVPGKPGDILSSRRRSPPEAVEERRAIRISVVNGDLMFVREPLLIGHYRAARLTGTEQVMDRLIGGAMRRSLAVDVYPDRPSSYQVFKNTHVLADDRIRVPRPTAVIVVGLGEEGSLTAADLVLTVRKGVIAWAERVAERQEPSSTFDLAATLIGTGGKGMEVAQVAPLLAEAVSDADALLQSVDLPRVGELKIVELFLDRATDAWHALMDLAKQAPHRYQVEPALITGSAPLRRVPGTHYRGADYDFVSIVSRGEKEESELAYTVDGRRARTDVARLVPQMPLLLQLLDASNAHPAPPDLGRTLFNLLVPIELEPFLGNATDIVLELDKGTSGIPWEMLDTGSGRRGQESTPWAIRSKIIRKLRVDLAGPERTTATADDYVLVIGEPRCDPDLYLRLPGARREAAAVADRFEKSNGPSVVRAIAIENDDVPGPDSVEVLSALYRHPYRIIHIAGHGEPTITGTGEGGVVLSPFGPEKRETYLSAKEIASIRTVPELVFVNCCHVGARERLQLLASDDKLKHRYNRPDFAATLAERLIQIGVKCVIVAGWAVDDEAAKTFALTFYDEILDRKRFIDATAKAREKTKELGGTTWAAFQCWGDPEWRYQPQTADAQGGEPQEQPSRYSEAASPDALVVTLETIATRAKFDPLDAATASQSRSRVDEVTSLERRFVDSWGGTGRVANAFGEAWLALGQRKKAEEWYDRAIKANDGMAPIRAAEQLANVRVRLAWDSVSKIDNSRLSDDERKQLVAAVAAVNIEIESLQRFWKLRPTIELGSIIGSAFKRLAMIAAKAGDNNAERNACSKMRAAYAAAEDCGANDSLDLFYPAWNRLVADAATTAGRAKRPALDGVERYRMLLARKREKDEDFWSAVAEFELEMVEAVARGTLAAGVSPLETQFRRLAERVPAPWMWGSVYENSTFVLDIYGRRLRDRGGEPTPATAAELAAIDRTLSVLGELAGKRGRV
jgi:hypothetical protein